MGRREKDWNLLDTMRSIYVFLCLVLGRGNFGGIFNVFEIMDTG